MVLLLDSLWVSGIGGAAYVTPMLILLGVAPLEAVGSDVAFLAVAKSWGSSLHLRKGNIDFKVFKPLLLGATSSAMLMFFLLTYIL